jgi:hypothetical protein
MTIGTLSLSTDSHLFPSITIVLLGLFASAAYIAKTVLLRSVLHNSSDEFVIHGQLNLIAFILITFGIIPNVSDQLSSALVIAQNGYVWVSVLSFGINSSLSRYSR